MSLRVTTFLCFHAPWELCVYFSLLHVSTLGLPGFHKESIALVLFLTKLKGATPLCRPLLRVTLIYSDILTMSDRYNLGWILAMRLSLIIYLKGFSVSFLTDQRWEEVASSNPRNPKFLDSIASHSYLQTSQLFSSSSLFYLYILSNGVIIS